jgi:muramoyltetrapeptide carboxypeptidase
LILAKRLQKGDGIGIFSPSSPATYFAKKRYKRAKHFIESNGFKVIEGSLTGKSDFYRSGSIKERAKELNDLISNDEVQCIMSSIGGMNSNSLLPYIDYTAIKSHPKIIIGYSDVTALLLGIYSKTGLITFYGPAAVASLGEFEPIVNETFSYFSDIVIKKQKLPYYLPTPKYWTDEFIDWEKQDRKKIMRSNKLVKVHGGKVEGRLIGGNLNTMLGIWNTEYMPDIREGDILFIEDSLKNIQEVEREFSLLKISGVFEKISGIILGKHEGFDDQGSGRKHYEVLQEVMGDIDIPFISEFDCCHTHPMLTLPIGAEITLDADNLKVTINSNFII